MVDLGLALATIAGLDLLVGGGKAYVVNGVASVRLVGNGIFSGVVVGVSFPLLALVLEGVGAFLGLEADNGQFLAAAAAAAGDTAAQGTFGVFAIIRQLTEFQI